MKHVIIHILFFYLIINNCNAQGTWVQVSNHGGGNVELVYCFSINNKGFVGGGRVNGVAHNDLWEYHDIANSWTQKANLPGVGRASCFNFTIGSKGV
ncbi:MAG TPA: kelch repeat-containing protein [Bacteroidia bacterium]|nr:kelch repeat-containing protein [Bacteroidia bacterium]